MSSATLLVASPRYSKPSCILPSGRNEDDPEPAGPGLPEQAPSVYAIHARAGRARCQCQRRPRPRSSLHCPTPSDGPGPGAGRPIVVRDERGAGADLEVARGRAVGAVRRRAVADLDAAALGRQRAVRLRAREHALSPQGGLDPGHRRLGSYHGRRAAARPDPVPPDRGRCYGRRRMAPPDRPQTARSRHPRRLRRARRARRQRRPPREDARRSTRCSTRYPHGLIGTSGPDVGLPPGQMGNSEVGHLNFGAGRIAMMDISRIDNAVHDGTLGRNPVLARRRWRRQGGRRAAAPLRVS